ncbi:MAG: 3-isopropylmalate dehydrogenase [Betaproteobacteria bacterium]|nr:3-isopropylmalate dehydrogenase [Betaproteobacteria bacterium]
MKATIAVIPGDGIGPEIVAQAIKALKAIDSRFKHQFDIRSLQMGFNAWKTTGTALTRETIEFCRQSDGILLGATGAADSEYTAKDFPPGWGRRELCRELKYYASVRPVKVFPQTMNASPIKAERIAGTDLVVVRDMTLINKAGLARDSVAAGGRFAQDILEFQESEITPTLKFAFLLARSRSRKLCLMTQSSLFATSRLWLRIFEEMANKYADVAVQVQAPDNCAMQLMRNPAEFDVIVTDNTAMGGMINNLGALLIGSIGMAPGTSMGLKDGESFSAMVQRNGLYEPIHGSAPLRAGQRIVNPIGTVLAAAMLLRYSLALSDEANAIERAIERALDKGIRTYDIMEPGMKKVGTDEMGDRIAEEIETGH